MAFHALQDCALPLCWRSNEPLDYLAHQLLGSSFAVLCQAFCWIKQSQEACPRDPSEELQVWRFTATWGSPRTIILLSLQCSRAWKSFLWREILHDVWPCFESSEACSDSKKSSSWAEENPYGLRKQRCSNSFAETRGLDWSSLDLQ